MMAITMDKMKERVKKHQEFVDKVKTKFGITNEQAHEAIDIACDFNIENESDMMETLMIITHTMKKLNDEE